MRMELLGLFTLRDTVRRSRVTHDPLRPSTGSAAAMTDDRQREHVSRVIYHLFSSSDAQLPVSSIDLLAHVIAHELAAAPDSRPVLRLTDLARFEALLESFSKQTWTHRKKQGYCS